MRKNIRYLIIALLVLTVLVGVYFAVSSMESGDPSEGNEAEEKTGETLISEDMTQIENISLVNQYGSAVLSYTGSRAQLENETLPVNGDSLMYVFANACGVTAEKNLGEVSDISIYGLDKPSASVKITMEDGSARSYILGDSVVGGGYYLMLEGNENVYVSDSYMSYVADYRLESYAKTDLIDAVAADRITVAGVNTDGKTIVMNKNSDRRNDSLTYQDYVLTSPDTGMSLSEYYMTEYVLSFEDGVTVSSMAEAHPTDLSAYGLDEPFGTLTFSEGGVTHTITASKENADKTAYCMIDDYDAVYVIDYETYLRSFDLSLMEIQEQYLFIDLIDSISELTLRGDSYDLTYKISGSASKDDDPLVVTCGGKQVDSAEFKKLYAEIIGVSVKGEVSESDKTGSSILEIDMTYRSSGETTSVVYSEINVTKAAVRCNGKSAVYYVYTKDLDKLCDAIEAFINGKSIQK